MLEWLVTARKEKGLSTYELGKEAGIAQSTLSMIENEKRSPSVAVAKSIAAVLGFPWTRFFEDE